MQRTLARDGVELLLGATLRKGGASAATRRCCTFAWARRDEQLVVDEILVGVGRAPNVEGLGLEAVGVEFDRGGASTSTTACGRRTSAIFAAGDVCMDCKFTHAADAVARIVIQNALFFGRKSSRRW